MSPTKTAKDLTVTELQRLLNSRKSELDTLLKQKQRLTADLSKVEGRISALVGKGGRFPVGRNQMGPIKRPKNAKSLHDTVIELLNKNKKGFPLAKLADKVLETGYRTHSSDFKNVLYQCLYNSKRIAHDSKTGHYRLK